MCSAMRDAGEVSPHSAGQRLVSIIVPMYNEQEMVAEFHRRLSAVMAEMNAYAFEILYINDGSRDRTLELLMKITDVDQRVQVLDLSRNFGKEAAMSAGLEHARGEAAIIIDADLQDPPELIPEMLKAWEDGYEMVCMQRVGRDGETLAKKLTARGFYALMKRVGETRVPENVGDFRLLSRPVIEALVRLPERTRFMKGLFAWVGFKTCLLPYHRDPRFAGETKWNYWRLWNFALEGLTSFTVAPLKVASYAGLLTALGSLGYGLYVLFKTLAYGDPVPGYPSLMVVILFLGGLQLLALGVIGEYLGRMFIESKNRPLYLLQGHYQGAPENDEQPEPTILRNRNIIRQ